MNSAVVGKVNGVGVPGSGVEHSEVTDRAGAAIDRAGAGASSADVPSASAGIDSASAPPLPPVTDNMTPLSDAIRREAQHAYDQIRSALKAVASSRADDARKRALLECLVELRGQFVRLYVIAKWSKDAGAVAQLIRLFSWLRTQGEAIAQVLAQLGGLKQALVPAKIPNPDLSTALQVLVAGRPLLPTHGYLKPRKIPAAVILGALRRLDVVLSVIMARLPPDSLIGGFRHYKVEDGRVKFSIVGEFSCELSLGAGAGAGEESAGAKEGSAGEKNDSAGKANGSAGNDKPSAVNDKTSADADKASAGTDKHSALPEDASSLCLVDFHLGFRSQDGHIVAAQTDIPRATLSRLELAANAALARGGLAQLYRLLHDYALACKLFTLHRQLVRLRMGLWRGHLAHTYDAGRGVIVVRYWLKRRAPTSCVVIGRVSQPRTGDAALGFRWIREGAPADAPGVALVEPDGSIDIERLIHRLVRLHAAAALTRVRDDLDDLVDNAAKLCPRSAVDSESAHSISAHSSSAHPANASALLFRASQRSTVTLRVDRLSGQAYFEKPTPLQAAYAAQINRDPMHAALALLQLRQAVQQSELAASLAATGWQAAPAVIVGAAQTPALQKWMPLDLTHLRDDSDETAHAHPGARTSTRADKRMRAAQLARFSFYRRRHWPSGWFLAAAIAGYAPAPQFWLARMRTHAAAWNVEWAAPLETDRANASGRLSYAALQQLARKCMSLLVRRLIEAELVRSGCRVKPLEGAGAEEFARSVCAAANSGEKSAVKTEDSAGGAGSADGTAEPNQESARSTAHLLVSAPNLALPAGDALLLAAHVVGSALSIRIYGRLSDAGPHTAALRMLTDALSSKDEAGSGATGARASAFITPDCRLFCVSQRVSLANLRVSSPQTFLSAPLAALAQLSRLISLVLLVDSTAGLKLTAVSFHGISFQYGEKPEESLTLAVDMAGESPISSPAQLSQLVQADGDQDRADAQPDPAQPDAAQVDTAQTDAVPVYARAADSTDAIHLVLPKGCPPALVAARLDQILADHFSLRSVSRLITYLRLTLPLCRAYQALEKDESRRSEKFSAANADPAAPVDALRPAPDRGFFMAPCHLETLRIIYYRRVSASERISFVLAVELRHRRPDVSLQGSVYLITVNPARHHAALSASARKLAAAAATVLQGCFAGPTPLPANAVRLRTALSVQAKSLEKILQFLHAQMCKTILGES